MVYDWEGKETDSYRLYVEERKSLDEVMEYWKQRGFAPRFVIYFALLPRSTVLYGRRPGHDAPVLIANSKRAFQTQFKVG